MSDAGYRFSDWMSSSYYQQLYAERDQQQGTAFVDQVLSRMPVAPDARLIDASCGSGIIARHLHSLGYQVTGVDADPSVIDRLLLEPVPGIDLYQHDLRLPFWISYFNSAFLLFNRFGFFRTEREHSNVIRTLSQSLNKEGTLVIDYLNVHYAEENQLHKAEREVNGVSYFITKWYDETHFYKKIQIADPSFKEPIEFKTRLAKLSLGDFNDMFAFHGLQMQEVFGDYSLNAYDLVKSPRLIMVGKKG